VGYLSVTLFRVPTGPEKFCKVLKNEERKIRPCKVLKLDIGPEKVLKKCWYLITMVLKNQLGQHVSCTAVVRSQ